MLQAATKVRAWARIQLGKMHQLTANCRPSGTRPPTTACARRLDKIKTGSNGDIYYEMWTQPHGERTVLTKPKVLSVEIKLREVKQRNSARRATC